MPGGNLRECAVESACSSAVSTKRAGTFHYGKPQDVQNGTDETGKKEADGCDA
jgi:hypothetical protein